MQRATPQASRKALIGVGADFDPGLRLPVLGASKQQECGVHLKILVACRVSASEWLCAFSIIAEHVLVGTVQCLSNAPLYHVIPYLLLLVKGRHTL